MQNSKDTQATDQNTLAIVEIGNDFHKKKYFLPATLMQFAESKYERRAIELATHIAPFLSEEALMFFNIFNFDDSEIDKNTKKMLHVLSLLGDKIPEVKLDKDNNSEMDLQDILKDI